MACVRSSFASESLTIKSSNLRFIFDRFRGAVDEILHSWQSLQAFSAYCSTTLRLFEGDILSVRIGLALFRQSYLTQSDNNLGNSLIVF